MVFPFRYTVNFDADTNHRIVREHIRTGIPISIIIRSWAKSFLAAASAPVAGAK